MRRKAVDKTAFFYLYIIKVNASIRKSVFPDSSKRYYFEICFIIFK